MNTQERIAKTIKSLLKKAMEQGQDSIIYTDNKGHTITAVYHTEADRDGAPIFLMEDVCGEWEYTDYVIRIENELVFWGWEELEQLPAGKALAEAFKTSQINLMQLEEIIKIIR